jgi:hypothetical protein
VTASPGLPTRARFPSVLSGAGHYESFFAKLTHPAEPLGVWIRYTVHKRPGAPAQGSLWFTLFDAGAPVAGKVTLAPEELGSGPDHYIHVGASRFGPRGLAGSLSAGGREFVWDLLIVSSADPYHHLPRGWMYRAPIPRTKVLSPHPGAVFSGAIEVDGCTTVIDGWPGTVGHNWGAQHAERWIWLHGTGFEGQPVRTWFDAALGRIKLGPLTTPWIANGRLVLDGVAYRLGGPERLLSTKVAEGEADCEFVLPGAGVTVRGWVGAEAKRFVGWIYADPDGGRHHTVNCSVAAMTLSVERPGGPPVELHSGHGAAYELGAREAPQDVPIQPFPDG